LLQKQDAHNNEVKELQLKLQEAYSIIDEQKQYIAQLESSHKQKNNELEISIEEYKESEKVLQQQCDKYQGTAEKEKKQRTIIQNELEKANACIEESQTILKKQQEQLERRDTQIHKLKQDLEDTLMKNQKYEDMLTSAKQKKEEQYSKIYNELLLFKSKEQEWLQDRHKLLTQIDSYKKSSEKLQHFKKEFQLYLQEKKNARDRDSLSSLPTLSEGQTYQELLTEKELYIQQLEAKIKNIRSNAPNNKYSTIDNSCAEMYLKI
jgi:chromosome segregation ATPase